MVSLQLPIILSKISNCKSILINRPGLYVRAASASAGLTCRNLQPWKCLSSSELQHRTTPEAVTHSGPRFQENSRKGDLWHTNFTHAFGISLPIVGVPMAGIAGARWAYEVTRAGGLGFLGGEHALASANGYMQLCDQMEEFQNQHHHYQQQQQHYRGDDIRVRCNHVHSPPLCIGFISHSCLKEKRGWDRLESILIERRPKAVQFFAPYTVHHPEKSHIHNIRFAQSYGAKVVVQVDTLRDAQQALHAGVDALIVQRTETCDHDIRREYGINTTLALALEILAYRASEPTTSSRCPISNIPILAGGGIVDARSMAAMMAAGLDGVALGPRMFASYKAKGGNKGFRNALLDAANSSNDTIGNVTLDQIDRSYCSEQSWLEPYNSVGALGNDTTPQWDGRSNELNLKSERTDSGPTQSNHQAMLDDNPDIGPVLAGQDMGRICSLVREISQEAADILKNTPRRLFDQVEIDSSSDV